MSASNKEISRKLFENVWNEGKVELLPEFHATDFVITDPYNPIPGKGPDVAKQYMMNYKKAFPDLTFRLDNQIAEGDYVVNFITATGTHEGELLGIPPCHKKATASLIVTLRFKNGKIVESNSLWDAVTFLRNAGVFEMLMEPAAARR